MKIIAMDSRLKGGIPVGSDIIGIRVNELSGLDNFVTRVLAYHAHYGNFEKMRIFCHGFEQRVQQERAPGGTRLLGGFGLQFCHEGIRLETAYKLSRLHGKIRQISILGCRAAETGSGTTSSGRIVESDGLELMGRIALFTGAQVRASISTQAYVFGDDGYSARVGEWEGTVMTWDGNGVMSNSVEVHESNPVDTRHYL